MSVIDKIKKRLALPVNLPNGESVYVSGMMISELERSVALGGGNEAGGFVIGKGLLNDDQTSKAFTQSEGETDKAFGLRVYEALDSMFPVIETIVEAIMKASTATDAAEKALEKN